MNDINIVTITGRLVRDPELKHLPSGTAMTIFSIASNFSYKKDGEYKDAANFFDCVSWGAFGEKVIIPYCKKGSAVTIQGRLAQRQWEDKDGKKRSFVNIVVENMKFEGSKQSPAEKVKDEFEGTEVENPFGDQDIPF